MERRLSLWIRIGALALLLPRLQAQAWTDVATWDQVKVKPVRNLVYRVAAKPGNASANPDPGTPGGIVAPAPPTAGLPADQVELHLDVLQVESAKPTPVVLQLYGGGWIRGDRPASYTSFRGFLAAGMSVVEVQYRLAGQAPAPAAVEDVRCALAWIKRNAAKYNFDPERVVTYGESAGGHIALMAAYAPASYTPEGCGDQPRVRAVLDFYGPTDLVAGLGLPGLRDITHQWLGLDEPLAPGWAGASDGTRRRMQWPEPTAAVLARAREMSPVTYVHKGQVPTYIVYGDHDPTVDPTQDTALKKALDAAGVPDGIEAIVGRGHGKFSREEDDAAKLHCLRFLQAQGVLPK